MRISLTYFVPFFGQNLITVIESKVSEVYQFNKTMCCDWAMEHFIHNDNFTS